ncbi:putative uncharacterized protein [Clostridium sp. CAG:1219]|mgnify:FL=1|nr:putative uncharacterized protein [Clostridium sp. CAG:1219]
MTTKGYLIREGYINLRKHGSKTFSTMLVVCATMLIIGIFILLFQNVNSNVKTVREEQGLQAFIQDSATEDDVEYMKDQIKNIDGVKEVTYITKEMGFENAKEVFKDYDYFLTGLENVDIFPRSLVIKFSDISVSSAVKSSVEKIEGIYKVQYDESTINAVTAVSKIVNIFLLGVGVVLLVVSIFIISNTIKLAVYSNKREVFIMRYMGATNKFIKTPFVIEGALIGMISATISFILISIAYIVIYARIPNINAALGSFGILPYSGLWYQILIVFFALGLFIGIFGSSVSVKKYLKV